MSYHNGSIWPHDNALLAAGLRRYNFEPELLLLTDQLFSAAFTFPDFRLPELYCGFPRGQGAEQESAPAGYPVSCSPQAWAAGTPVLLLQALLGLEVSYDGSIHLSPLLPPEVQHVELLGLTVGPNRLDIVVTRDTEEGVINWHHVKTTQPHSSRPE
jgi:glycogen debranching enzyme